jgi:hypothetical protein
MDNFATGKVWHEPATYVSAYSDLFPVDGSVRTVRIDWIVQLFR